MALTQSARVAVAVLPASDEKFSSRNGYMLSKRHLIYYQRDARAGKKLASL